MIQLGCSGKFLCSRIGGSKRAISDRRPNRAFLTSRKRAFSIPIFSIERSDPRIPLKKSTLSTGCADRIARSKLFEAHRISHQPRKHTITPYNSSDAGLTAACCCCSHRVGVAHPVLRPPAARTVIRWQQCVLSMTCSQHRCCCCACFGDDSRRSPTPQPRQ